MYGAVRLYGPSSHSSNVPSPAWQTPVLPFLERMLRALGLKLNCRFHIPTCRICCRTGTELSQQSLYECFSPRRSDPFLLQFYRYVGVSRTAGKLSPREGSLHSSSTTYKIISVCCWTPQDVAAQPTCSTSSNIPTCRWTLHLSSPGEFYEIPPLLTPPFSSGFSQKKQK